MAHLPLKKLAGLDPAGQSKILLAEFPGRTGVYYDHGKTTIKQFGSSVAALRWCEENEVSFFYLRPEPVEKN